MRIARATFVAIIVNLAFIGAIAWFSPGIIAGLLTLAWLPALLTATVLAS